MYGLCSELKKCPGITIVSNCCTSPSSTSRSLSTRICLSKPIPQSTYNTLANHKILSYFYLAGPPSSIPIALFTSNTLKCHLLSIFGKNNTVQPHSTYSTHNFIEKEFRKKYNKKRSSFTQIWYRKLP
jgi:hypothetical protein